MRAQVSQIIQSLNTHDEDSVRDALDYIQQQTDLTPTEKNNLAQVLSDVFYHAHHTGSTRIPKLAVRVQKCITKFGPEMIPFLFEEIIEADSESVSYFGKSFARLEQPALAFIVPKLIEYRTEDDYLINIIHVLSYFRIPETVGAISAILNVANHKNHQVTSIALYTVGRLIQKLPIEAFSESDKAHLFNTVFNFLSNAEPLVRKNTARTLGKMLRKGLLSEENEKKVFKTFMKITGKDDNHNWDRAFIVRREAEFFLPYFKLEVAPAHKYTQSFRIVSKKLLCPHTFHFTIEAPLIAQKIEAGQFIIIRAHEHSERIPLSVCDWDEDRGTVNIIISAVGKTTTEINAMKEGDCFKDVVGPLGNRSSLPLSAGTCVVIGGGYGTGAIIPTAKDLKNVGNKVIGIVGARNKDYLIMVDELKEVCDEVYITTNDGSQGLGGMVTDALWEVLHKENVIHVLAIGPVPMMKAISEMTRPHNIETFVSLNAIMVDGTGMCGACRVTVGGETKFACFHGPDFDGHKVDFENLTKRQKMFEKEEKLAFVNMENR